MDWGEPPSMMDTTETRPADPDTNLDQIHDDPPLGNDPNEDIVFDDEYYDELDFDEEEGLEDEDEEEEEYEEEEEEEQEPPIPEEPEPEARKFQVHRDSILDFESVQNLVNMLAKVKLVWPENMPGFNEDEYRTDPKRSKYPQNFIHVSPKEKAVLWHAENFRKQFAHHFPDRRPMVIAPRNECGVQKLFPTYIKPRLLGRRDFFDAQACATFFQNFLSPDFQEPMNNVPKYVRSHLSVFKDRKANAFEHSIIVASCLLGAGYIAYVVDGYASREVTTLCFQDVFEDTFEEPEEHFKEGAVIEPPKDETEETTLDEDDEFYREDRIIRPVSPSKYRLRFKKVFASKYEQKMQGREDKIREEQEEKEREEAYQEALRNIKPPTPDPMGGYRTHAWVLILPGTREVETPVFLEPFTGTLKPIHDPNFLGIESIFNHRNFYANIQPCPAGPGIGDLSYDFEDPSKWAKLLVEPKKKAKKVEEEDAVTSAFGEEEEEETPTPEMMLDMPVSWVPEMHISAEDYKKKYPDGKKSFEYSDAMVELATPYAYPDGMIRKVIKFNGKTRKTKNLLYIEERFSNRIDKLKRRKWIKKGRMVHEFFEKGRKDALKEHIHMSGKNKPHFPRHLYYYASWHGEGVNHRQVVRNGLVEHFENRSDFLYYRFTAFGGVLCSTLPQASEAKSKTQQLMEYAKGDTAQNRPKRKILGIIEKYHRDPSKNADEDIAEKHMLIEDGKFHIFYHYGDENFTRSTLDFFKVMKGFKKEAIDFTPEQSLEFRVDPFTPVLTNHQKYQALKVLQIDQARAIHLARKAEDEVYSTVIERVQEDWAHELEPRGLDFIQDEEDGDQDKSKKDEDAWSDVVDFASPYLVNGLPRSKQEEIEVKRQIMKDAKARIARKAKFISACYGEESRLLQGLLNVQPTPEEEALAQSEGFQTYFDKILWRMHIMEQRLVRLRAKAPGDYCSLLIKVLQHPLLNRHAIQEAIDRELEKTRRIELALLQEAMRIEAAKPKSCCQLNYFYRFATKKIKPAATAGPDTAASIAAFLPAEPVPAIKPPSADEDDGGGQLPEAAPPQPA